MTIVSQTGVTTTFEYDAFQREVSQTDGRGNTTRTVYDSLGRVASTIDALGYATAYGYDALGRQTSVTDPLTNTVTTAYDAEGHVISQRGATYPVDYSYDEFGEKISMTTYRNAGGPGFVPAAGDTTRWLRDEATGLVTNKVYADGKGPCYTYTPDGKLETNRVGLFCICSTVYAARVAGSPLRGARFPVRHSAARAEVPPCRQTKQLKNEVLTSNRDLTKNDLTCVSCQIEIREGGFGTHTFVTTIRAYILVA